MNRFALALLIAITAPSIMAQNLVDRYGAISRSDTSQTTIYLCFTGHDFAEGFDQVLAVLTSQHVAASFFLTGDFIRQHPLLVKAMARQNHFVGAHSDKHLLYADWSNRDSLLYTPDEIKADIRQNLVELRRLGIYPAYFMPPYEWYNQQVVELALELNQLTVSFSPGTRSNADYTTPDTSNYVSSSTILESIQQYERLNGLNGFHLLIHPGTSPLRTDKFYTHLNELINELKEKGYQFSRF